MEVINRILLNLNVVALGPLHILLLIYYYY